MLLKAFYDALNGDTSSCLVASDYIQDHHSPSPERNKYVEWLRVNPSFITFTEAIAKYGDSEERHLIRKVVKHAISLNIGRKKMFLSLMEQRIATAHYTKVKFLIALEKFGIK